ncbi:serine hydrolase domain-containing protein [Paenibacillus sp. RC67]|uniref:serine hydrolase domain-containing protein n=1 Tax=Paenibacillus sp. RC67 TaxID=3039392 RepID=UPI0024AD50DA|nr:serine hydrolase domain-containing protein [Paenibacillus sp. RC67]
MNEWDAAIRQLMEKHRIAGLAASVIRDGQMVWSGGYGWANLDRRIPVTNRTIFRIASISKTVVATAFMQLVERGLCSIDQDVGDILGIQVRNPNHPELPLTFRHLMTHTSGLQDEYARFVIDSRNENPPTLTLADLVLEGGAYYTDRLWGNGKPGDTDGFEYSNLGAVLMAAAVEKLSNGRFDLYCRKHLFEPLQMNDTSFHLGDFAQKMDDIAVLYEYLKEDDRYQVGMDDFMGKQPILTDYSSYVPGTNGSLFSPQGGLRTTVDDLTRFMQAHAGDGCLEGARILRSETAKLMHSAHWTGYRHEGFFKHSGLQFHRTNELIPGQWLVGHAGDAYGLLSDMYFHEEQRWGFILIMNGVCRGDKGDGAYFRPEEELAGLLYETFLKAL